MNPQLTIVVPVYNASEYIERCVTSLMEQTLCDEMEFLFIDDGSTDCSIEIIERIAHNYPQRKEQIRIVRNSKNEGVYITRKRGIEEAKGQYIGWCDSDDWVDKDYYQNLLDATQGGKIDIVVCDFTSILNKGSNVSNFDIQSTPIACIEQGYCKNSLPMVLYVHLFKKEIIRHAFNMIYPTEVGEDTYSILFAYASSDIISKAATSGYYYDRRVATSIMNTRECQMKDWLPHQYNLERITKVLYEMPNGKERFHKTMNSMKYWRKLGYRKAFHSEREFYYTFRECYKDINVISHTPKRQRWFVYCLYNFYPVYCFGKRLGII